MGKIPEGFTDILTGEDSWSNRLLMLFLEF